MRLFDLYRTLASQVCHVSKIISNQSLLSLTVSKNNSDSKSRAPSIQVKVATKTKSTYQCHMCQAGPFKWETMKSHAASTHYIASKDMKTEQWCFPARAYQAKPFKWNTIDSKSRAPKIRMKVAPKTKPTYQCHICQAGPFKWKTMKSHAASTHNIASKDMKTEQWCFPARANDAESKVDGLDTHQDTNRGHKSRAPSIQVKVATNLKEVIEELQYSLNEWGLQERCDEHYNFRQKVLQDGLRMASYVGSKVTYQDAKKDTFPLNIGEAYEKVLKSDAESLRHRDMYHRHDSLNVGGFGEPFSRWYDKRAVLPRVTRYRKKPQYKRFSNSELDPLQRYKFHRMTKPKFCFNRWFFDDDKDSEMGTLFESWFSCHALQHESCFNCKGRNSLRWYGGSKSSWQDIICTACHSTYEVKSKATMEKLRVLSNIKTFLLGRLSAFVASTTVQRNLIRKCFWWFCHDLIHSTEREKWYILYTSRKLILLNPSYVRVLSTTNERQ